MTDSRRIRLAQQGYKHTAIFNQKERAQLRAEFHRKQGNQAAVIENTNSKGLKTFSVWVKIQEV